MRIPLDAPETLNREFLELRARLLSVAAALDRIDRAGGAVAGDPRMAKIRRALEILGDDGPDRAERFQLLFSREYEADWRERFGIGS
jgi:hypothetical protein